MLQGFSTGEHAAAIFYRAPVPIAYVSSRGEFLAVNDEWCALVGYSESELMALKFQDITHPQDIAPDESMVKALLTNKGRRSYKMVKRYITKQGRSVWIDLRVNAVWEDEKFDHFVSWAIPLPNGGSFKLKKNESGKVSIRPVVRMADFLMDNWKIIVPIATGGLLFLWRVAVVILRMMEKTGTEW